VKIRGRSAPRRSKKRFGARLKQHGAAKKERRSHTVVYISLAIAATAKTPSTRTAAESFEKATRWADIERP
jgi:hypothetical protein